MDASYKHPVVAVVGPTATGKTALGVALAEQFGGEVISADSMQIYKGLDVGTAKVTPEETHGIPHHGVDILEPDAPFSVADFTAMAGRLEQEIAGRGHLPILVGGTGLYVQSFLYGVRFTEEKAPAGLREQLAEELAQKGGAALYAELQQVDPEAAAVIHPNNQVRVLRALEHYRATGKKLSEQKAASLPPERPYRSLILGLDFPDRAALYRRIDLRVDKMLDAGLLAEAELVWNNRSRFRTAAQAIGYKEFFPYFEQTASLEACADKLKQASRNYAKRQLTWFRHMDGVVWLDAGAPEVQGCWRHFCCWLHAMWDIRPCTSSSRRMYMRPHCRPPCRTAWRPTVYCCLMRYMFPAAARWDISRPTASASRPGRLWRRSTAMLPRRCCASSSPS